MDLSIVIPAYNEKENIVELYKRLSAVLKQLKKTYEIIFVDDGSSDGTFVELDKISKTDKNVKVIKFRKNFGQTAAWSAGFDSSKGDLIITMDSDLQNDPKDIPKLLKKISEGYDVVSGWRHKRKDKFFKKFFSLFSRFLRKKLIKDQIHDSGCSLKVYKKEAIKELELHGEMHRYIVELLALKGYKIGEVKVKHYPRLKGKTKYNLIRLPKGFLDLILVAFWQRYSARPLHLFGGIGLLSTFFGVLIGIYLVYIKFKFGVAIANRPLLLLCVLFIVLGVQFIIFGIITDILTKIYYSDKKNYSIEKILR
ncbi:glycosyltransferase family 2 protein [archaeon]|jgi:glycosyltransferase involved in cell wall biosynthesis|nr:glycosyltransferase family 2 protein [archaeon]MBT4272210.1 glycosyltransferase family 2 protein [archaeon]MBT4460637.1 glycosyltransferase family 2 protein [archaeon]MBT4858004.1 glycosyltransferase family 2 protein [archaeon]MBT5424112.1 glycosyltransferase family 2 protein [archaeon]